MKSRVFSLVCVSMAFLLSFVILIIFGYAQTDNPDLVNPQEMIKKAFPNSKISWSKEIHGEMVNFKATSSALAIMIGNGDKRRIEFVNFEDTSEWSIDCDYNSCRHCEVVGKAESRLLIKGMEPRGPFTSLYGDEGKLLFILRLHSWLYPSPDLGYFHTKNESGPLKLYDTQGKLLRQWSRPHTGVKFAGALSDSELVYLNSSGCVLFKSVSGEQVWEIPRERLDPGILGWPKIWVAANGEYFIITGSEGIVSISRSGKILWIEKTSMHILAASISENGRFIALYREELGKGGVKKLELLDNFGEGKVLWSKSIETSIKDVSSDIHGLRIKGNELSLIPGFVSYCVAKGITPQMQTFYFEIDTENGELLNKYTIDGVCEIYATDSGRIHYLLVHKGDKKEIFRIVESRVK